MNFINSRNLSMLALLATTTACGAAAPTQELVSARDAYQKASGGAASEFNPAGLHEAEEALREAEEAFADEPESAAARHKAYIALRKAEIATAKAEELQAQRRARQGDEAYREQLAMRADALAERAKQLEERVVRKESERADYAQQLTEKQRALREKESALEAQTRQVEQLEAKAQEAKKRLAAVSEMREEAGRLIFRLSGVSFETGSPRLTVDARTRLDSVAKALSLYTEREILVEGHTDAQGNEEANRELSRKRALAVQNYLEIKGVDATQLRAVGRGEDNPVASNETREGRAKNRRVEISVAKSEETSKRGQTSSL